MKPVQQTLMCVVISAVVASPNIGLAGTRIYPNNGQTAAQQRKDISECRSSSNRRHVVRETATGAAIGAVGGAITGNAGQGAAVGAAVGAADSLTSRSGKVGRGAITGAAIGAAGGAITGNAGRGAGIGAGVGAANRALRGNNSFESCMKHRGYTVK
jgi:hypothetical protein